MLQNDAQAQLTHVQGINIDISVEFSYEELSTATQDFSLANKIGQGGFVWFIMRSSEASYVICWYTLCGRHSVRFESVRFGSSPTSRHSSVVRPRVRHTKHGAPQANITMTSSC
ncbi:putative non-specific serine/threonine protein kinase [Helianthus anomalus]